MVDKDDDGNEFTPGECICDLAVAGAIIDVVIQGLSELDSVLCGVILSAIVTLLEEGLDKVPGGSSIKAVEKAVEGAKTFFENGLDGVSYFGNWIGGSCGISDFSFNLEDEFADLLNQPDSLGVSVGCFKANQQCPTPKEG